MMDERLLRNKIRKAKKDYECEACLFLFGPAGEAWDDIWVEIKNILRGYKSEDEGYTVDECKAMIKAWRNGMTIKAGEMYRYQYLLQDNYHYENRKSFRQMVYDKTTFRTFRAIPAIHEICCKYGYYDL